MNHILFPDIHQCSSILHHQNMLKMDCMIQVLLFHLNSSIQEVGKLYSHQDKIYNKKIFNFIFNYIILIFLLIYFIKFF